MFSIFDICHMGEFVVEGNPVDSGLDKLLTMSIVDMPVLSSRYGMILNEQGCVIDDLIVFRLEEEKWFCVVNGATMEKDAKHFKKYLTNKAQFTNVSRDIGKIDIQGPESRDVLKKMVPDITRLKYFQFDFFPLLGENVLISRTGYTGELGYEIFFPWNKTKELWRRFLKDDRVKPAGLGARDVLRLEMGYSLYGHELNDQTTPLESALKRFVDWDKDFLGKEALLNQQDKGVPRVLVGLSSESRRSPRADQKIYSSTKEEIGIVTSGSFSPCLKKGIGLGFVIPSAAEKGNTIYFGEGRGQAAAVISAKNFYTQGSVKS